MNIKNEEDKHTRKFYFGVTKAEEKKLDEAAREMSMTRSAYIRYKLFAKEK